MGFLTQRYGGFRLVVVLLPVILALLHAAQVIELPSLNRLDNFIYDLRLRLSLPGTLDERVVIVDIDERSLAETGQWPWGRNRVARLIDELTTRQRVAAIGLDVVFAEADRSSGLTELRALERDLPPDAQTVRDWLARRAPALDYDAQLAAALARSPTAVGYYFTSDRGARRNGVLPAPVSADPPRAKPAGVFEWTGYGANIASVAGASSQGGFINAVTDADGIVRSAPMLAWFEGQFYQSLSLALYRRLIGEPPVKPDWIDPEQAGSAQARLKGLVLQRDSGLQHVGLDGRGAALVPYRGPGGPEGGSFAYHSASDVLNGRLPEGSLAGKIVLVGFTAPGLMDLRATPVGEAYPGVEVHANLISGLLDGRVVSRPDYAAGYQLLLVLLVGLLLATQLPRMWPTRKMLFGALLLGALVALDTWLYRSHALAMPLATVLVMTLTALVIDLGYGYFVEARTKRELAGLFGSYVPPELVDEMLKDPRAYSMRARAAELTVMFCDMRGFTSLSEGMEPVELQQLLNAIFSRLTDVIQARRGTIDKYIGDCIMAFWGAPVATPDHARLAVDAAQDMVAAMQGINTERAAAGLAPVSVGIGIHTGVMAVGDMGSRARLAYTAIGDGVNLASRLEGLCRVYGVEIVVSESTRALLPDYPWQELDRVRVKGRNQAVTLYQPLGRSLDQPTRRTAELERWNQLLLAWRAGDFPRAAELVQELQRLDAKKFLYQLFAQRIASRIGQPPDPHWDGTATFDDK